ncbi:restriction endonuclease subunit S [Aeromonas hydrophila]|uniref:restriction endonuclease subunit S n=1 Tax=Aeromonas hydrophila TaxID=644 RepID=UPI00130375D9|nr:restriction endonuclease subunit S [Aeromonas hydrophila]QGZ71573.1 restriction endonuclease subunit S [Aeromonas hydrophila]
MSSEWQEGKLGDFIELKRGYDLPQAKRIAGRFPLVSSSGITDSHNEPMAKGPGVVTGRYGTIGQVFYIEDDFWPLNTTLYVRDFKSNDPKFISYLLCTVDFFAYSDKAAVPGVNRNHLHEAMVRLPGLDTQKHIANVLATLDDRIALLRETNATLEAIAQALFKSWFVDFDPVHARARGEEPAGLSPEVAALFPDSFEESELGMVPKGWDCGNLGDVLKIAYGKNLPTAKLLESGFPVFGGNGRIGFYSQYLYEQRQVLVACRGAASGKINQSAPKSYVTNNSLVLESNERVPFGYLKGFMSLSDLSAYVTGSAQPQVTIDNLKGFKIMIPSQSVTKAFESLSSELEERTQQNNDQAQTLATLRDTLLPRLISGQLRLPEALAHLGDTLA